MSGWAVSWVWPSGDAALLCFDGHQSAAQGGPG
jgi:hypothetical protein